ncbi:transcription antitermination factor NusB [Brackiella oedipodis]|uniref:transcription antitermination factor NusB n=1 Tax=Brackiella oedipodis TaxID=124225 RepID=UPI000490F87B|nr:transcription antitermination factor NusB [Brackiella oedipodis]
MSIKKSARRLSREFALKGLYGWLLSKHQSEIGLLEANLRNQPTFQNADAEWFKTIYHGVIKHFDELKGLIEPALDRSSDELSPVEFAVLLIGSFELKHAPDIPYRVVINEAVEIAKEFGATDGYKFINGVLDKIAPQVRPLEAALKS